MSGKNEISKAITVILLILALAASLSVSLIVSAKAEDYENMAEPRIWTDKEDYAPEENVTIYGEGFTPNASIRITVLRPDNSSDTLNSMSDEDGKFKATYQLDGIEGLYKVKAEDEYGIRAETEFTDCIYRYFTATINPTTAYTGETKTYTITITNDMSSSCGVKLGSAKIMIPSGFTSVTVISVLFPSGKDWGANVVGNEMKLKPNHPDEGLKKLARGESVSVIFNATAPANSGSYTWTTNAYVATNWAGFEFIINGSQPQVNVTTPPTVEITITSSPITGVGFVKVDGTAITTPTTFTWTVGSTHTLEALSPVSGGTGIQYVWTSWSDGGTQTHTYTVPSSSETVIAYYKTQYNVTVTASPDETIGGTFNVTYTQCGTTYTNVQKTTTWSNWVDANTNVTLTAPEYLPSDEGKNGVRYKFSYWDVNGTPVIGNQIFIHINASYMATAHYIVQYSLTIGTEGLPNVAYATDVYLDGLKVGTAYDSYPLIIWFNEEAQTGTIGVNRTIGLPYRYIFVNWKEDHSTANPRGSVVMNEPKSFTAVYGVPPTEIITITADPPEAWGGKFNVTYTYLGVLHENEEYTTPYGLSVDPGTIVTITYVQEYVPSESGVSGVRYGFIGYDPLSQINSSETTTITLTYKKQYKVTFRQVGIGSEWAGVVLTVNGTTYRRGDLPLSVWCDEGSRLSFEWHSPLVVSGAKQYSWYKTTGLSNGRSGSITVNSSGEIVGYYRKEKPRVVPPAGTGGCKTTRKRG